jgi:hypothetical protein
VTAHAVVGEPDPSIATDPEKAELKEALSHVRAAAPKAQQR